MIVFVFAFLLVLAGCMIWLSASIRNDRREYLPNLVSDIAYDENMCELSFIGGISGKRHVFIGSGTVWRNPDGRRVDTITEGWLSDIMARYRIEEKRRKIDERDRIFNEMMRSNRTRRNAL